MFVSSGASKPAFAIIAIVLGFVVHGAQAFASCGDYLHTVHSRPGNHATNSTDSHTAFGETTTAKQTERPAVPCSGPGCQRNDGPLRPPQTPATGGASSVCDALLNSAPRLKPPTGQIRLPAESATPRDGFPGQQKKPPRCAHA